MQLSDKKIEEFQELYLKHFGKKISRKEANEKGNNLILFIELIYKPMTKEMYCELKKYQSNN